MYLRLTIAKYLVGMSYKKLGRYPSVADRDKDYLAEYNRLIIIAQHNPTEYAKAVSDFDRSSAANEVPELEAEVAMAFNAMNDAGQVITFPETFTTLPLITYQPQTLDPFANTIYTTASLSTKNSPLTIAQCNSLGNASTVPVPWGTAPHQINCDGLSSTGSAVNLAAGTYIFYSSASRLSSIAVTGGSISCNGCTIIMTGDSSAHIGTINITGTITLTAPATNDFDSNFNGVLFYRDQQATANANATTVTINGTAGSTLTGVMYFPTSTVTYTGNGTNTPSCSVIIAAYLKLTGGSQFSTGEPSTGGCAAALVPWTQSVRLVK